MQMKMLETDWPSAWKSKQIYSDGISRNYAGGYSGVSTLAKVTIKKFKNIDILICEIPFPHEAHGINTKKFGGDHFGGCVLSTSQMFQRLLSKAGFKEADALNANRTGARKRFQIVEIAIL